MYTIQRPPLRQRSPEENWNVCVRLERGSVRSPPLHTRPPSSRCDKHTTASKSQRQTLQSVASSTCADGWKMRLNPAVKTRNYQQPAAGSGGDCGQARATAVASRQMDREARVGHHSATVHTHMCIHTGRLA
uniref:Uncharacterized protein n=1 Tax=Plectus sambesii TaxID=2011161 RepID=A0A914VT73_9BILA